MAVLSTVLGHPRIGLRRELKFALEKYWQRKLPRTALEETARTLMRQNWQAMKSAGIDHVPTNDFSLYDHMLDTAVMLGLVPQRFRAIEDELDRYFAMARGQQGEGVDIPALEMTKWFDTNYHYIVPELEPGALAKLHASELLAEVADARAQGVTPRPVIVGPITFLKLSKLAPGASGDTLDYLDTVLDAYASLLTLLHDEHVDIVQLDEPCLVLELSEAERRAYQTAFARLATTTSRPRVVLTTYFGALRENLTLAVESGFEALHVDLVRAPEQLDPVIAALPPRMALSLGVIDGRNVWRSDLAKPLATVRDAMAKLGADRVWVAPSCSLLHVPVDLTVETALDDELRSWLAFAAQKLFELRTLSELASAGPGEDASSRALLDARRAAESRRSSSRTRNPSVRSRVAAIAPAMLARSSKFATRAKKQAQLSPSPLLPTTTIGSFPQTGDVRATRASWRAGKLDDASYQKFLREETARCIQRQEQLGIDVLVHGEFERTDMVEYFGEQLAGFAFTQNGWVQSYGSRCVKPPVLFGDVARPQPMTVAWTSYAQSLTKLPVKGMLTGPVTILQWSFVRDDQPRSETCVQIALALREEVQDLEAANVRVIQVDEPAIREGLPLRRADWSSYLRWAVDSFLLSTTGVRDETQIHTHMCYSEFGDILEAIAELDADSLSIETSRSKLELLSDFETFDYPNGIGPGVYDIHSPRVPTREEIEALLRRALRVIPPERIWVNPDCGLKTRGWPEVERALQNMVEATRTLRRELAARA